MNINEILQISVKRANRWHNGSMSEWSALEWAGAMAGEAGEACNAAKKLKRLQNSLPTINELGRHYPTITEAQQAVAREVADTILYGVLLAARVGVTDLEGVIREVFNKKSVEYNFPETIPCP